MTTSRNWFQNALDRPSTPILVQGSPTSLFHGQQGLRQGHPMSPFLFIVVQEVHRRKLWSVVEEGTLAVLINGGVLIESHLTNANVLLLFYRAPLRSLEMRHQILAKSVEEEPPLLFKERWGKRGYNRDPRTTYKRTPIGESLTMVDCSTLINDLQAILIHWEEEVFHIVDTCI